MKKLLLCLSLLSVLALVVGCELTDEEDPEVRFYNLSSYTVQVTPNGGLWEAFAMESGQDHKIKTSGEVFFTFEPDWAVEVGKNDGGRIYFVNIGSESVD